MGKILLGFLTLGPYDGAKILRGLVKQGYSCLDVAKGLIESHTLLVRELAGRRQMRDIYCFLGFLKCGNVVGYGTLEIIAFHSNQPDQAL